MCINPVTVYLGSRGELRPQKVACRKCWQCISQDVQDWQGRCIAETITSKAAHFVTLTYGRDEDGNSDHMRAAVLTYSDVQKMLKLLRKWGFPVRYFVAGEFGTRKGRCHWHILLFWQERVPPGIRMYDDYYMFARLDDEGRQALTEKGEPAFFWPHGHAYFKEAHPGSARYAAKYATGDLADGSAQRRPGMSKQPPLGAAYLAALGERYAAQGIAPQGRIDTSDGVEAIGELRYEFSDVRYGERAGAQRGKPLKFFLRRGGASEAVLLTAFVNAWRRLYGDAPMPRSRIVEEFCEPGSWANRSLRLELTDRDRQRFAEMEAIATRARKREEWERSQVGTRLPPMKYRDRLSALEVFNQEVERTGNGDQEQQEFDRWYRDWLEVEQFWRTVRKWEQKYGEPFGDRDRFGACPFQFGGQSAEGVPAIPTKLYEQLDGFWFRHWSSLYARAQSALSSEDAGAAEFDPEPSYGEPPGYDQDGEAGDASFDALWRESQGREDGEGT